MDIKHLKLKHPFTAVVSGPTGSGKTFLVRDLLENYKRVFYYKAAKKLKVIWAYGQWQDTYNKPVRGVKIKYIEGLPNEDLMKANKGALIILDDLMSEISGDVRVSNLFTKGSHHLNISVLFIVQNVFNKGKEMRTVNLNTHYYFLLKNPRDKLQCMALGRQIYPGQQKYFMESYSDATSRPYGYLCIDLKTDTPDEVRMRTNLFEKESIKGIARPIIYTPKK